MGRRARGSELDPSGAWRNVPGYLYLNGDVLDEIRQLSGVGGKGTVDELGFQVLYDRIAQKLFPWCSTLTSRARYFYFSLGVLELALKEAVNDDLVDPNRDSRDLATLADQKRMSLMRVVRRIERAIALSLVTKHEAAERGIFGSIRCRRWFREDAQVSGRGRILSSDARYPNAIYRGSCRELSMFALEDSSTTGLLRARLSGFQIFNLDWHTHSKLVLAAARELDGFWQAAAVDDVTFKRASADLSKLPVFKAFRGFPLTPDEGRFLYERLQHATPYLRHIPLKRLTSLVNDAQLDPLKLKSYISDKAEHELFDAAHHIDAVTTPFRGLYQACARNRAAAERRKVPVSQIRKAKDWLDKTCRSSKLEWASIWSTDISWQIDDWIRRVNSDYTPGRLLDALCERAEQVVRGRGQGKQAPHERSHESGRDEADLRNELDVRETSFRLGNGTLILKDIALATSIR